jgi:hypothetical protein
VAVGAPQITFGVVLVVALVALAAFYAVRQVRTLRRLRTADPSAAETGYRRTQARRRLASSALLLVLAGLLAGALGFLEGPAQRLADRRAAQRQETGEEPRATAEEQTFFRLYSAYWVVFLLVLLAVVVLAFLDLLSTRRFGREEHRKLREDRRSMIEHHAARLRQERNGA